MLAEKALLGNVLLPGDEYEDRASPLAVISYELVSLLCSMSRLRSLKASFFFESSTSIAPAPSFLGNTDRT